jgi:signal transduction histidine kinase
MAQLEISGLRRFTQQLSSAAQYGGQFLAAVRRLAEEFTATTGIAVSLKEGQDVPLNDRLAAEAFQMIAEGLSNIRRHTKASEVTIEIERCPKIFNLRIADNGRNRTDTTGNFIPKSITARAASLGGRVDIELPSQGKTVLNIGIPI